MELRPLPLDRIVCRAADGESGGAGWTFTGHATVFNTRYAIGDPLRWGWWEEFDAGAVDRALDEEQDVRLLVDHDPSKLLARTASKTLDLAKDKRGLAVEAQPADTTVGRDVRTLMERGDLDQMSLAFVTKKDAWEALDDGSELRTILDVDLYDVSVVTFPANPDTDAQVQANAEAAGYLELRQRRLVEARSRFDRLPASWGRK